MKSKKDFIITFVFCLFFLVMIFSCKKAENKVIPEIVTFNDFDTWLDAYLPTIVGARIPAVQIALTDNGEIVYQKAFGLADKENNIYATNDTIFQVASISKSITAWGIMALSEKQLIDIEAPIQNYVKKWKLPKSKYNAEEVTISRVMSHTAGLNMSSFPGYHPLNDALPSITDSLSGQFGTLTGKLFNLTGLKIKNEPGSKFSYSGGGYTLLQLMMEECAPGGYVNFMNTMVLQPLGMISSSFEYPSTLKTQLAKPYSSSGKERPNYLFTEKAAAGLYTTAGDLAKILNEAHRLHALSEYTGVVISADSFKRMITPRVINSQPTDSGLGYFLEPSSMGNTIMYHNGGNRGWNCCYAVEPATGRGIVVLINSDEGIKVIAEVEEKYFRIMKAYD